MGPRQGMIARHARMMWHGWNVPHTMEWLFWPIGYHPADLGNVTIGDFPGEGIAKLESIEVVARVSQESLMRRFTLTNHEAFLAQLHQLGVVKEQKP